MCHVAAWSVSDKADCPGCLFRGDLFVELDESGRIVGSAIINQIQVKDAYVHGAWLRDSEDDDVMVLHTLAISPRASSRGWGKKFVAFYEEYAKKKGCHDLRMDTNERNLRARAMYRSLGYREIGCVPTVFNGIAGVNLVLIEKVLE